MHAVIKPLKKGFFSFLTLLLVTLTLIALTEGLLRLVFSETATQHPFIEVLPERAYTYDPDLLIALRPNTEKSFIREDKKRIEWKINSHGFRGPELKKQPKTRVMVYGDSMIQARFASLDKSLPFLLQKNLNQNDLEVINAGIVGYGPDQNFLRLKKEFPIYKPNAIVFTIFADNDYGDLVRNRLFDFKNETLSLSTVERKKDSRIISGIERLRIQFIVAVLAKNRKRQERKKELNLNKYHNHTMIPDWLVDRSQSEHTVFLNQKPQRYSHFDDHYDIDLATSPNSESALTKIKFMGAILDQVQAFCDTKNIPVLFVILPSSTDLCKNLPLNFESLSNTFPNYRRENLTQPLELHFKKKGYAYLNLYLPFKSHPSPWSLFFNGADNHWNEAGMALAAPLIAKKLKNQSPKLFPPLK